MEFLNFWFTLNRQMFIFQLLSKNFCNSSYFLRKKILYTNPIQNKISYTRFLPKSNKTTLDNFQFPVLHTQYPRIQKRKRNQRSNFLSIVYQLVRKTLRAYIFSLFYVARAVRKEKPKKRRGFFIDTMQEKFIRL